MALNAAGRLNCTSCLDSVSNFFIGRDSIFTDSKKKNFFTSKDHIVTRKLTDITFVDKVLKLVDPILDLTSEIKAAQGASKEELDQLKNGRLYFKTGRDVISVVAHVSSISGAVNHLQTVQRLASSLISGSSEPVVVGKTEEGQEPAPSSFAVSKAEKVIALVKNALNAIAAVAYFIAFALCKQIANFEKYIVKAGGKIDPIASEIGKAFQAVITVNHATAAAAHALALANEVQAYDRAAEELKRGNNYVGKDTHIISSLVS